MKLALAQMNIRWEDKKHNIQKCKEFLCKAKENNVDFIVFPEMTLTGFSMNIKEVGEKSFETLNCFKELSVQYNIFIGIGHVEISDNNLGKNMFSIIDREGKVLCSYCKIHPFSYGQEHKYYQKGENINFAEINGGLVSPFICYDLRFPEIFQIASKKASLITISANWPEKRREHWMTLLKARAIENQCYIAGVNVVGDIGGIKYSGDSMIIDPEGKVLNFSSYKETLIMADIDLFKVIEVREKFKLKDDRREELYYNFNHLKR